LQTFRIGSCGADKAQAKPGYNPKRFAPAA
jgi:hypothetical protein